MCHSVPWLESMLLMVLHSWVTGSVDLDVLAFVDFVLFGADVGCLFLCILCIDDA